MTSISINNHQEPTCPGPYANHPLYCLSCSTHHVLVVVRDEFSLTHANDNSFFFLLARLVDTVSPVLTHRWEAPFSHIGQGYAAAWVCHLFEGAKTILLGDSGVGKTSLLVQFDTGRFQTGNFSATVGIGFTVSNYCKLVTLLTIGFNESYPSPKRVNYSLQSSRVTVPALETPMTIAEADMGYNLSDKPRNPVGDISQGHSTASSTVANRANLSEPTIQ
uniref:Ras-related protein Rab-26 n=1 Tax=Timema cristinae TaxID=61476 RepID=A0A7R9CPV7_TIMCR|nr:unnamed protein product [Timema cristinae]